MVSETVAWSPDMHIEHVTGIRQYYVPIPEECVARKYPEPSERNDVHDAVSVSFLSLIHNFNLFEFSFLN